MANKNPTEISLMKGITVKLTEDIVFTLGYFVHTEEKARAKSEYLYVGRVDKLADLQAEANDLNTDAKKLLKWTWKGLPKYESVVYDNDDLNSRGSRWLQSKIKKIVDWETFCKVVDGWKEQKNTFNDNAKYVVEDYTSDDGTKIQNLKDAKDILPNLVGQSLIHSCVLKLNS
jgi:exopolysaccharide biosynthesis predicted pyruvyltransferase EpsI